MKRRAKMIVLFLLLGAIVNVAVAWACAAWPGNYRGLESSTRREAMDVVFPTGSPPARNGDFVSRQYRGFGWCETRVFAHWLGPDAKHIYDHTSVADQACMVGWPSFSLIGWIRRLNNSAPTHEWSMPLTSGTDVFPLRPLWPGFAINTIFYAAILWLPVAGLGALRRRRRIKRALCPACAYPVGTNPHCTECGIHVVHSR